MSDARLRELERRWKETADPEAGAAYLRARIRNGTLSSEALELAAYLGDRAACAALETPAREPPPISRAPTDRVAEQAQREAWLGEWVKGLNRWGKATSVRAALAVLQGRGPHSAIERAEAWLADPTQPAPVDDETSLGRVLAARGTLTASLRAAAIAEGWVKGSSVVAVRDVIRLELVTWLYGSAPPIEVDDWAQAQVVAMTEKREQEEQERVALLARVTAGELTAHQLELLAHLGHPPARRALKLNTDHSLGYHDMDSWLNGIGRYGVEALARAATALRTLPWHHERPIRWREGSRSWARSVIKQLDTTLAPTHVVREQVCDALIPWVLGEAGDADLR